MTTWCVVGNGAWGSALAARLAAAGHAVRLVGPLRTRQRLPGGVHASIDLAGALAETERVVLAVPIAALPGVLAEAAPHLEGHHRVVTTARGLTPDTNLRASEVLFAETCVRQAAVLAGAADAAALERGRPVALVVGSRFPSWAKEIQAALASSNLRVYTNADPVGVEIANALAVILAVAMGIARALGVGAATEATALTRALAEVDRLVRQLGGEPGTAFGLAGLGVLADLVFEAEGDAFAAGQAIASGRLEDAARFTELREGARALTARAASHGVRAPLVGAVHALFEGHTTAPEAIEALMTRAVRSE